MFILFVLGVSVVVAYVVYRLGYNTGYDNAIKGLPHYFNPARYSDDDEPEGPS
jgi:hypothetical protein